MAEQDVAGLEEELAGARAELERLREESADREARLGQLQAQLAEARSSAQARDGELAGERERAEALAGQLRSAAERYRAQALAQSPELPEELVTGETVEEVEASLAQARETVAKVRGQLESEAQAGRVPVGAPPRSGPDFSGLSTQEKIRRGLGTR